MFNPLNPGDKRTFADVTEATATAGTTEVKVGTITLSAKAKKIIGIWAYAIAGGALTGGQPVTGIVRFDSPDINIAPLRLPLDVVSVLTSGAVGFNPRIFPVEIPATGMAKIDAFITLDMNTTTKFLARVGLIYEGEA